MTTDETEARGNRVEARVSTNRFWLFRRAAFATGPFLILLFWQFLAISSGNDGSWVFLATLPVSLAGIGLFLWGMVRQIRAREHTLATGEKMDHFGLWMQALGIFVCLAGSIGPLYFL